MGKKNPDTNKIWFDLLAMQIIFFILHKDSTSKLIDLGELSIELRSLYITINK